MKVNIQSIHFKADQKLKDYLVQKLDKLETFFEGIIDAQVYLKVNNKQNKDNKEVDILINMARHQVYKSQEAQTFEAAIDIALESLKKQLKRLNDRLNEHQAVAS